MPAFRTITSDEGVRYEPWTDGWAVGFKVTRRLDDRVEYIYLNPSGSTPGPEGSGDVFLYHDTTGDSSDGETVCYIDPFTNTNTEEN